MNWYKIKKISWESDQDTSHDTIEITPEEKRFWKKNLGKAEVVELAKGFYALKMFCEQMGLNPQKDIIKPSGLRKRQIENMYWPISPHKKIHIFEGIPIKVQTLDFNGYQIKEEEATQIGSKIYRVY